MLTRKTLVSVHKVMQIIIILSNGILKLRNDAVDTEYVWVIINGDRLVSNVDYYLTEDKNYLRIVKPTSANDKIEFIEFAGEKLTQKFGYRVSQRRSE